MSSAVSLQLPSSIPSCAAVHCCAMFADGPPGVSSWRVGCTIAESLSQGTLPGTLAVHPWFELACPPGGHATSAHRGHSQRAHQQAGRHMCRWHRAANARRGNGERAARHCSCRRVPGPQCKSQRGWRDPSLQCLALSGAVSPVLGSAPSADTQGSSLLCDVGSGGRVIGLIWPDYNLR